MYFVGLLVTSADDVDEALAGARTVPPIKSMASFIEGIIPDEMANKLVVEEEEIENVTENVEEVMPNVIGDFNDPNAAFNTFENSQNESLENEARNTPVAADPGTPQPDTFRNQSNPRDSQLNDGYDSQERRALEDILKSTQ
jgi:hypothetical protein